MADSQWIAVDQYITDLYVAQDPVLESTLRASVEAGLPPINVSPPQGKFLHLLARMCNARRILEVGTLGAYSTIWLARALPADGRLITLEADPKHAQIARINIATAKLSNLVEVVEGQAIDSLEKLAVSGNAPFDLIFIDADKPSTADYFNWALKLSRPGSVIIVDNVVRKGAVIDKASADPDVQGIRRFNQLLAKEKRVTATAIQTVGSKGYDGFAVILVVA